MAAFRIHEDVCNYIPTNIVANNNNIRPKVLHQKESRIPTKRMPLRSANNVISNKNSIPVKKETVICHQVEKPIQICKDYPQVIEAKPKEIKVKKSIELFQDLLIHDTGKENVENFYAHSHQRFYFPRDQLYLTTQEYHESIYAYLTTLELSLRRPRADYMLRQPELTFKMRSILVDWLCCVAEEYNMQPQTLHLAVQLVDCFLGRMSVIKSKFQLVGTAAMMIAAKYEEIYPPDTKEWAYLTADSFTPKQLLRMEQMMLKNLDFDVAKPTAYSFINHICYVCDLPKKFMLLAMYLSELVLLEGEDYIKYLPSQLASASVALARHTLDEKDLWPKKLETKTGYTLKQLSPIIKRQNESFKESPTRPQQAIQQKFKSPKYGRVSLFKPKEFEVCDIMEE